MYNLKVNAPKGMTVEEITQHIQLGIDEYDEKRFVTSHEYLAIFVTSFSDKDTIEQEVEIIPHVYVRLAVTAKNLKMTRPEFGTWLLEFGIACSNNLVKCD